jgi:hypothetical protein
VAGSWPTPTKSGLVSALEVRRSLGRQAPGECRLSYRDGGLVIEHADPHVWLDDEFLRRLVSFEGSRNKRVSLVYQPHDLCQPQSCCQRFRDGSNATSSAAGWHCYYGAVVTIRGTNRTVIYRIGRFLRGGIWEAKFA